MLGGDAPSQILSNVMEEDSVPILEVPDSGWTYGVMPGYHDLNDADENV